jgi:hypothetical protein
MMLEPIQTCLGHAKLETTQIYAKLSAEMIKTSDQKALGGGGGGMLRDRRAGETKSETILMRSNA